MAARKGNNSAAGRVAAAAAKAAAEQTVVSLFGGDPDLDDGKTTIEQEEVLEDLQKIDEEHGGGITWELYCSAPFDKAGQIGKLTRDELSGLRDHCLSLGPGQYYVIARGPQGLFVPNTRRKIKISGLARGVPGDGAPATAGNFNAAEFMAQLLAQQKAERAAERTARWDSFKVWGPIMAPVMAEVAKGLFGRAGGGESIKDLVGALASMKELAGGTDRTIEMLMKGIELARDIGPESSSGKTWPDALINGVTTIAKEFRPLAESMAKKNQTSVTPAATPQLQYAPVANSTPPTTPPAAAEQGDEMWDRAIRPLLLKLSIELEEFAANATDPNLTADALLAKVPRVYMSMVSHDQLKIWLTDPQWWSKVVSFRASLHPYQAFCDDVRQSLLAWIEDQQNPPKEEEPE